MAVETKKGVKQIPIFIPAKSKEVFKRELGQKNILKLSANESRMGCSPKVAEALLQMEDEFSSYPDVGCTVLKEKVASFHGVKEEQVVFGNGSFELILLIAQAYLEESEEVITPVPSFGWYIVASFHRNAIVKKIPLKEFEVDLEGMLQAVTNKTKIIWLCNPNNPTGKLIPYRELKEFVERVPQNVLIVLDEAYIDFAPADYQDAVPLIQKYDNLVVLRTFSKLYGLASFRIGYALAQEEIIQNITRVKLPINVSAESQVAAIAAFADQEFKKKVYENNRRSLQLYYETFRKWNLNYLESNGNFVMVNLERDSREVEQKLAKHGILVRNGEGFGYINWLRITIGTYEDNQTVLAALGEILNKQTVSEGEENE
ncbi:MAG: histidinol-phosphate transaminase [Lachnospiraceae bacterium]